MKLLEDHTTHKNIIWATDSYESMGEGYGFYDEITIEKITGENGLTIRPRALKQKDEQQKRVKDKAEVFTPSWICNAQNNLIDEAWFGRPDVFNKEITLGDGTHTWIPTEGKIQFSGEKGKTWQDYVKDMRLEITCGEAPYLVSRYDAVTGEPIEDLNMRIGLLDRKLRVVSENLDDEEKWREWAKRALESTYGYEWQGDSLLLAREAILMTVLDYYKEKFGKSYDGRNLPGIARIISWNLWQMDGLKYVIPGSCDRIPLDEAEIMFPELGHSRYKECNACKKGIGKHIGRHARIMDWEMFNRIGLAKYKKNPALAQVSFIQLVQPQFSENE